MGSVGDGRGGVLPDAADAICGCRTHRTHLSLHLEGASLLPIGQNVSSQTEFSSQLGQWRALRSQWKLLALCLYYWTVSLCGQGYQIYTRIIQEDLKVYLPTYLMIAFDDDDDESYVTVLCFFYNILFRAFFSLFQTGTEAYVKCAIGFRDDNGTLVFPPFPGGDCRAYINPEINFWAGFFVQVRVTDVELYCFSLTTPYS